jgi:hypothetical protein
MKWRAKDLQYAANSFSSSEFARYLVQVTPFAQHNYKQPNAFILQPAVSATVAQTLHSYDSLKRHSKCILNICYYYAETKTY